MCNIGNFERPPPPFEGYEIESIIIYSNSWQGMLLVSLAGVQQQSIKVLLEGPYKLDCFDNIS